MKRLSVTLALFGVLALVQPARQLDLQGALLGSVVLICAATTFRSTAISSFLKIFVGIFSTETIVLVSPCWLAGPGFGQLITLSICRLNRCR